MCAVKSLGPPPRITQLRDHDDLKKPTDIQTLNEQSDTCEGCG